MHIITSDEEAKAWRNGRKNRIIKQGSLGTKNSKRKKLQSGEYFGEFEFPFDNYEKEGMCQGKPYDVVLIVPKHKLP